MAKCKQMRKESEGFEGSRIASVVWPFCSPVRGRYKGSESFIGS